MTVRIVMALLVSVCMGTAGARAADAETEPAAEPGIVLVGVDPGEDGLLDRIREFVEKNYSCPTRLAPVPAAWQDKPRSGQAEILAAQLKPGDVCLVAVYDRAEDTDFSTDLYPELRTALVNAARVERIEKEGVPAEEMHERMVERACMRAIGTLIGLEPCPWPRCCMHVPPPDVSHEVRGRNLCPPCQDKADRILREKGVTLLKDGAPAKPEG
ncbi:MAG: hypothetical protein JW951_06480 [Lentisphaerae bacterium]|nr:hypothetical protein [Lentisphaerota bacterium]